MSVFPSSFPGSTWMPVPDSDVFDVNTHQAIVIHKTASPNWTTAQAVAQGFIDEAPGSSVHYIVGLDGAVVQCVSELSGAGGNCCCEVGYDPFWQQFDPRMVGGSGTTNLNTVTLSIEHVDTTTDNSQDCTPEQLAASFALVLYLSQKWGIPPESIKPHSSIDPISRARCPGNYPFDDLIAFVQAAWNITPPDTNGGNTTQPAANAGNTTPSDNNAGNTTP